MGDYRYAFNLTQMKNEFGCSQGTLVTRRSGPDIACASLDANQRCTGLHERLKAVGLPAFDAEDDLLSVPHSVLAKVQFGGLLGLKRALDEDASPMRIDDIHGLVEAVVNLFGGLDTIPCADFVDDMRAYRLRRRG